MDHPVCDVFFPSRNRDQGGSLILARPVSFHAGTLLGRTQAAPLTPRCYPRELTFAPSPVSGGVIVSPPNENAEADRMEQISLLRKVRLNRGWTQAQLGARARVNKTTISLIENGRFVPAAHHLQRLAEALRFPLDRREELTGLVDR